jgi:transcriptional regulator with XRE-family HTH domain
MANLHIIRDLSEKKQITLREIANRINISEDGLQKIIKKGSTNTATLERISQVLDVPVGFFFDENTFQGSVTQRGRGNFIANSYNVKISECESKLEIAQAKIESLEALLEEKERTIQILMKK